MSCSTVVIAEPRIAAVPETLRSATEARHASYVLRISRKDHRGLLEVRDDLVGLTCEISCVRCRPVMIVTAFSWPEPYPIESRVVSLRASVVHD